MSKTDASQKKHHNSWPWKKRRFQEKGFCLHCSKNKAGQEIDGKRPTATLCGPCADKHRKRNSKGWIATRRRGRPPGTGKVWTRNYTHHREKRKVVEMLLKREELRAKMNPVRIDWADLRRQAMC